MRTALAVLALFALPGCSQEPTLDEALAAFKDSHDLGTIADCGTISADACDPEDDAAEASATACFGDAFAACEAAEVAVVREQSGMQVQEVLLVHPEGDGCKIVRFAELPNDIEAGTTELAEETCDAILIPTDPCPAPSGDECYSVDCGRNTDCG